LAYINVLVSQIFECTQTEGESFVGAHRRCRRS